MVYLSSNIINELKSEANGSILADDVFGYSILHSYDFVCKLGLSAVWDLRLPLNFKFQTISPFRFDVYICR